MNRWLKHILVIISFMMLWQLVFWWGIYPTASFPSVFHIFRALWMEFTQGDLSRQLLITLWTITKGVGVGALLAVILAFVWRKKGIVGDMIATMVSVAHPLPGIALLPLLILWFGIGERVIVVMIVHAVVWPMLINIKAGLDNMPVIYHQIADVFSLSSKTRIFEIALPSSLPFMLSGLKTGWARAWRAMIAGEMVFGVIGQSGGLGTYLFQKRVFMDTPGLLAGLLVIIAMGIFVEEFFFSFLENSTIKRWGMGQ